MKCKYCIGIDEAGRGPLAGPVSVGVLKVPVDFDWKLIPGVNDSKQLSEGKREELFVRARELKKAGELDYAVAMVSGRWLLPLRLHNTSLFRIFFRVVSMGCV